MNPRNIKENLPLLGLALIFLSYCHVYNYYSAFGIDIFNYLDADEIVLSLIPSFIKYASFGVIIIWFLIDNLYQKSDSPEIEKADQSASQKETFLGMLGGVFILKILTQLPFGGSYEMSKNVEYFPWINTWTSWSLIITGSFTFIVSISLASLFFERYKKHKDFMFGLLFMFGCSVYGFGRSISGHIEYAHPSIGKTVSFLYKQKEFISGRDFYLLAETRNFILGFKKTTNPTERYVCIFSKEQLESLNIVSEVKLQDTSNHHPPFPYHR